LRAARDSPQPSSGPAAARGLLGSFARDASLPRAAVCPGGKSRSFCTVRLRCLHNVFAGHRLPAWTRRDHSRGSGHGVESNCCSQIWVEQNRTFNGFKPACACGHCRAFSCLAPPVNASGLSKFLFSLHHLRRRREETAGAWADRSGQCEKTHSFDRRHRSSGESRRAFRARVIVGARLCNLHRQTAICGEQVACSLRKRLPFPCGD
jgi:hypothetical protein